MRAWLPLSRLGVLVLSLMSTCLFIHVSSICRSSFYHLRNLSRIRKYFTKESAEVAVHAFVTSKLDYSQKLHYRSHTRSLRSVSNELLMQPRSYTKTYGDRAFAVYAPREWNFIPYEIRKSNTISSFRRSLKTYLFTKFCYNRSLLL
ncbi:unnamed protein product [Porites lobata]|uniref:Secreted protein n=1 Tax=Porites lobata TaxID=104759 RepID=A0ABN8PNG3_9CNID|nr:unnamed protein product [Porites lobata]